MVGLARRRARRWPWVVVLLVLAAIAWGVYLAYSGLSMMQHLASAKAELPYVKKSLESGDVATAQEHLRTFEAEAGNADHTASSFSWTLASHLPFVGENFKAGAVVTHALAEIGATTQKLLSQGSPLALLAPHGGRFDVAGISRISADLGELRTSIDRADDEFAAIDQRRLVGVVRDKLTPVVTELHSLRPGVDVLASAASAAPELLGEHGTRRYVLVFNNNAEIRATGGLPGVWAEVTASHGQVKVARTGVDGRFKDLNTSYVRAFGLRTTPTEHALFTDAMIRKWVNANDTPDFARSADIWSIRWEHRFGYRPDGIVGIDTVTLGYLLRTVGAISVGGIDITPDNAARALLNTSYLRLGPQQQNIFFQDVANDVATALTTRTLDPQGLFTALGQGLREGRLRFQPNHPLGVPARPQPQVGVYLNQVSGSKMSYYLRSRYSLHAGSCDGGTQHLTGRAAFHSTAPADIARLHKVYITGQAKLGTPPGTHRLQVLLYAPPGGTLGSSVLVGGKRVAIHVLHDGDRQVGMVLVQFPPGGNDTVTWTMTDPHSGPVLAEHTPGMVASPSRWTVAGAC